MIITKTPLRISFVGGGSDCPWFYNKETGAVISTTIDKYIYIAVNPSFDKKYRLHYSNYEEVDKIDDIKNDLVRETLNICNPKPIEITSIGDIPGGTGLGSSSSYCVGLMKAINNTPKPFLADIASEIEINKMGKPIGEQDQYAASYGGFNLIEFYNERKSQPKVTSLEFPKYQLEKNLLLFYTGLTHTAEDIHKNIVENISEEKREIQRKMVKLVYQLKEELEKGNIDCFGKILHENWILKKQMSKQISNQFIDDCYEQAINAGAEGGKILGAGGGGFLLFYAPQEKHDKIINSLPLRKIDFKFSDKGSEVIYVS